MKKKLLISAGIHLLCSTAMLGQFARKYQFTYTESVLSNYSSLLQKQGTGNFNKVENKWTGHFLVEAPVKGEQLAVFFVSSKEKANPANQPDNVNGVPVSIRSAPPEPVNSICYSFYPGRDEDVLIRNILSAVRFFKFNSVLGDHDATEDYADGQFSVSYRLLPVGREDLVLEKEKWTIHNGPPGNLTRIIIDSFYCRLHYGVKDSIFRSLELVEWKHQKLGDRVLAYVKSVLNIEQRASEPGEQIASKTADTLCTNILNVLSREERKAQISRNVLKDVSYRQFLGELQDSSIADLGRQHLIGSRLRAILFLHPDFFGQLKPVLDTMDPAGSRYQLLMNMMLGAESAPVQQYLAAYLDQHARDYDALKWLLPPMGVMTYLVDPSLLKALTQLLYSPDDEISSLAGLALSNMSGQLKYNDTARHQLVNQILYEHYRTSAKQKEQLLQYLKEIGNSGDESRTTFVLSFLESNDKEVKATAVSALRFLHKPEVDSALASLLKTMPNDSTAAAELMTVLSFRYPSPVIRKSIYDVLARQEVPASIKNICLDYLAGYADEFPLASELGSLSLHEKDLDTRLTELRSRQQWYDQL